MSEHGFGAITGSAYMAVVVFLFVIAAAFLVLALVGPYRLYWRSRPQAARQPSDAALTAGRVVAFGIAGVFVFGGCSVQAGIDERTWSASEVREAAEEAAESLADESRIRSDPTDGYASLIEAGVTKAGEGEGPSYDVSVERAGDGNDYEISADGAGTVCMHVMEEKSAEGGVFVPGADGGSSGSIPEYDLTATVEGGAC
ncbi:hypothetical protein PV394_23310 [Streptomyces sp. NE06-03E]|uniref:Uncharacterized protein n=2 Tax=Streptomyces TaxID=1883 RepID=A0ABU8A1F8_9ACTN|nr:MULTISPECIES: hypothetical protein [unclassified Streptomyces]WSS69208.1 hypothetical protein OG491_13290 [Streptomyces sp. NBC_01175]WSS76222.1 hypothetical protein OG414_13645 [Streptomyces sp. NBC_01174]MDX3058031.1 hypothetical protein [Streptomyces sp. NE06-03E]MDX3329639.1 hypothetical protein [Streptomyces sp. ME02-6979-3A]MDX3429059.1 hypothetical protein [Streptomyces sp. ME01-18a]